MCKPLSIFDLKLINPNSNHEKFRRDLKRGFKLFLLSEEEKAKFDQINFDPQNPDSVTKEFELASNITGILRGDISGVSLEDNILSIDLNKV